MLQDVTALIRKISIVGRVDGNYAETEWITFQIGGVQTTLYVDTGSDCTILPPYLYNPKMGRVITADAKLTWM